MQELQTMAIDPKLITDTDFIDLGEEFDPDEMPEIYDDEEDDGHSYI
jgi:hypothetical protein